MKPSSSFSSTLQKQVLKGNIGSNILGKFTQILFNKFKMLDFLLLFNVDTEYFNIIYCGASS